MGNSGSPAEIGRLAHTDQSHWHEASHQTTWDQHRAVQTRHTRTPSDHGRGAREVVFGGAARGERVEVEALCGRGLLQRISRRGCERGDREPLYEFEATRRQGPMTARSGTIRFHSAWPEQEA